MAIQTRKITLVGGIEVTIPTKFEYSKCRGCKADNIVWATTKNGKLMPIRWSEIEEDWVSHFSDCPKAENFKKKN